MFFTEWPDPRPFMATPTPGTGGGGGGGGSSSGGSSSSSGSSGSGKDQYGFTEEGRKDLKARLLSDLSEIMGTNVKDVPNSLYQAALKRRGQFSIKEVVTWLRQTAPKLYLKSAVAKQERKDIIRSFQSMLGGLKNYNIAKDGDMEKLLDHWQLADNHDEWGIFKKFVSNSPAFKTMYPGFATWFSKSGQTANFKNPAQALDAFKKRRSDLEEMYRVKTKGTKIDEAFILAALKGDWTEAQFDANLHNQDAWKASVGAERDTAFKQAWDRLFYGTGMVGKYDDALLTKFRNDDKVDFDTLVETDIKNQDYFATAFPGWKAWSDKQVAAGANPASITVAGWRSAESDKTIKAQQFRELYATIIGDPNAVADDSLIQKAVDGNWSASYFELYFKKNDPGYKNTSEYKNKAASFSQYWKNQLGEDYNVDQNLVDEFAGSDVSDPQVYFDRLRNTPEFQAMFPNWASFSAGRTAAGQVASSDPLLYNEYRTAFHSAFAQNGLVVPDGFEAKFFQSGQDKEDFTSHVTQFAKQSDALQWQSGEKPDMATALDLGDKTKGGLLRKRLQESLAQQRSYMQSSYNQFQRDENAGLATRNI